MLTYHPALRFKQGEYTAIAKVARDIQRQIQPRFILPPPKESDPEKGRSLTPDEIAYETGQRIAKNWPFDIAFLDAQYVASFLGDTGLKRLFRTAQGRNKKLVAVATVDDLFNPIYMTFLRSSAPRIAVFIPYEQVDTSRLLAGIKAIGCSPQDCVVFIDFNKAPFELEGVEVAVAAIFDELAAAAQWHRLVFQGSAFPKTNPAKAKGAFSVPRHEWDVFHAAIKECSVSPDLISYGDYGPDSSEIKFSRKKGGRAPYRQIRYTVERSNIVVRGDDAGTQASAMEYVCRTIIKSGHYLGRGYSYADEAIYQIGNGRRSAGTPTMWRELNMAHHMTHIVRELGAQVGETFERGLISDDSVQYPLWAEVMEDASEES
ncbi:beta family protein [Rhizobium giardinii]|uniref:beta family protein n=1 Tax=Rhizobium giardinii TaxID=56731 RepID=UPI003D6FBBB1